MAGIETLEVVDYDCFCFFINYTSTGLGDGSFPRTYVSTHSRYRFKSKRQE